MNQPQTMLDVFRPPEGLRGHTAALVAMSATSDFLEAAMEEFTGLDGQRRRTLGATIAYLMLDPHESPGRTAVFSPTQIPSLYELQPRPVDKRSLLHAKLAILGFAKSRAEPLTTIRLAVFTGNFTNESARRQLELCWFVDVGANGKASAADRADLAAAASFVRDLVSVRYFGAARASNTERRALLKPLHKLLDESRKLGPASKRTRFIHSLRETLYEQVRARLARSVESPRNLLLCGSGFWEQPRQKGRKPAMIGRLEKLPGLKPSARRVAVLEPKQAGALAAWYDQAATDGWVLVQAFDAIGQRRRMHAKFIYVGYLRRGHISNGWLYLGSGNLSWKGLMTSAQRPDGNVECGVVLQAAERLNASEAAERLFWDPATPADIELEVSVGSTEDAAGTPDLIDAPPILWATLVEKPRLALTLAWRDDLEGVSDVRIRWSNGDWVGVYPGDADVPVEPFARPPVVRVSAGSSGKEWMIPVIDPTGRVSLELPVHDTFDEAFAALLDFPYELHDSSQDEGDQPAGKASAMGTAHRPAVAQSKEYALYRAAEFVEGLAAKQATMAGTALNDWLEHLDRLLPSALPQTIIDAWRRLGLNPIRPLRDKPLCPATMTRRQASQYLRALDRAQESWGVQ